MPPLQVSPFASPEEAAAYMESGYGALIDEEIERGMTQEPKNLETAVQNTQQDNSLMGASTEFPSELITSR